MPTFTHEELEKLADQMIREEEAEIAIIAAERLREADGCEHNIRAHEMSGT